MWLLYIMYPHINSDDIVYLHFNLSHSRSTEIN